MMTDAKDSTADEIESGRLAFEARKKRNWKDIMFGKDANISAKFFISKDFLYPLICIFLIITVMEVGQLTSLMIVQQIHEKCGDDVLITGSSGLMGVSWIHTPNMSLFNVTMPS